MAGGGGETRSDNPLPLNVVPLIDVIFCLLLFFMCSFHFKTLEGKMEAWLPREKGIDVASAEIPQGEIRIVLEVDKVNHRVIRRFGRAEYPDDGELRSLLRDHYDLNRLRHGLDLPVVLEPSSDVPWEEVFRVMDLTRQEALPKVEFALAKAEFSILDTFENSVIDSTPGVKR